MNSLHRLLSASLIIALQTIAFPLFALNGESAAEYLVGGSSGIHRVSVSASGTVFSTLKGDFSVQSIVPVKDGWFFLSDGGPIFSPDLSKFESRTEGLPSKTLLVNRDGSFVAQVSGPEITSLAEDPKQPGRLAASGPSGAWYSGNGGISWSSLGSPSQVPGLRAISFGPLPGTSKIGLWLSHPTKGLFVKDPDYPNAWIAYNNGLPKVFGSNLEEVSGFGLVPGSDGNLRFVLGMSFLGAAYEWDRVRLAFYPIFSDGRDFGYMESPSTLGINEFSGISDGSIRRFTLATNGTPASIKDEKLTSEATAAARAVLDTLGGSIETVALLEPGRTVVFNDFWRIAPPRRTSRARLSDGRKGIYLQTGFVASTTGRDKYFRLMKARGLDMIVIDLKDDYGKLRFAPRSALLNSEGRVGDAIDIEAFVTEAKRFGFYLVARIVVFKDETLYSWNSSSLAVRNSATGKPWQGIKADGQPIKEAWVDPYSPEVWKYNIEIAKEIRERGFDEIQFDYIRFPTDGENLALAAYPSRLDGMTQDSALESFLMYARSSIDAPISVDIYGANGWYRTGARTGQDVEMMSKYVDVICPMLYPSHFEQGFLAQAPAELRPYRIYRLGTSRNLAIGRGKVLIRPYVQSFYLDVSYDKLYYDARYVWEEVRGVRNGADQGMTFWNNSGRYDEVPDLR